MGRFGGEARDVMYLILLMEEVCASRCGGTRSSEPTASASLEATVPAGCDFYSRSRE